MKFRRTLTAAAVAVLSLSATGCVRGALMNAGGTYTIKFAHVTTAATPKGQAADFFAADVEKRTNGRVRVQVYPNSELYGDKDEMQAIQSNSVQMLAPASAKFTTVAPALQVLDLPYLFETPDEIPQVAAPDTQVGRAIYANKDLEAKGMKVLGLWDSGMKQIHSNNRTVSPSDMVGKKYRIQPSDVLRTQFEKWGGIPTPLAFAEVYNGLQQGVIDGGENTWSNIQSQKMHTVQKYITASDHGYIGYVLIINKSFFDELPPDLQRDVEASATEASRVNRERSAQLELESRKKIEATGNTEIVSLTPEQRQTLRDAVLPSVYLQYRDAIGPEIVDELLARKKLR
ncbi:DctP family TRAP transporter solute-binding subunit [Enemella evansiae]|uniref:DctP family TRAP transporter solute-binding subunit n=1 Tax=Enemella evansiae TaxID=2016499 RepID=UPI000B964BB5|nr:DctP family TRAP transporter solute-binding subunit [Enemella evansiae]OYO12444.1 C4-dicarboxylate ABC transporter [Enemella evansiae]TDO93339.1 C4-dicarboxylate-binding protein DctP [Enemella evansiae]